MQGHLQTKKSSLRQRRRKRRVITGTIIGVIVVALISALISITWLPFLRVHTVTVSGEKYVPEGEISRMVWSKLGGGYFFLFARSNIFLYPQRSIEMALIQNFPTLSKVDVHATGFTALQVAVTEREPEALWCGGSESDSASCFLMDKEGTIYAPAVVYSPDTYQKYFGAASNENLPQQFLTSQEFHTLSSLVSAIEKNQQARVAKVGVTTEKDVRLTFDSGFVLIFTLGTSAADIFDRYNLAMQADPFKQHPLSDFEYLDLRFGDKMYYKLKPLTK